MGSDSPESEWLPNAPIFDHQGVTAMKRAWLKWSVLPVIIVMTSALVAAPALAQNSSSTPSNNPPTVHQRQENQQDRIANGLQSGQLTAGETANLEHKEAGLNREIRNDRAANRGKLTPAEKAQVNRQQNAMSHRIYNQKHK
jgi:maltodextrin utilization protein YvdJ